jgi:ketosteroid isomerase-like protein
VDLRDVEAVLRTAYAAFNARDLDAALAVMDPDVVWPNGMEGGTVVGHQGLRAYWSRQWGVIDPSVEPRWFLAEADGRVAVEVNQVVRDLTGRVLKDQTVRHVYAFVDGRIASMEIRPAGG